MPLAAGGVIGPLSLDELTRERVIEWRTARQATSRRSKKPLAPSTVNRELDFLKHVLAQAVSTYLDASLIAKLARLRVIATTEPAVLSRADEVKLLAARQPRDRVLDVTALDRLIRAGDLLELK